MSEVPFRRSIFARLVVSAILVSLAATLLLWIATAATIDRAAATALQRAVDVDLAGLADIYASGGEAELSRRIADRLALADGDGRSPHYLLDDGAGRRLAGDIRAWPGLSASLSQAGYVELEDGTEVFARATLLAPNRRLLVGREHGGDIALRREVGLSFLAVGALVAVAVGLFGRAAARRLTGRIAGINRAFRSPAAENLAPLVRAGKSGDEIGELARHSAAALSRQQRLADKHRETADQIAHELRTPLMHLDTRLVRALAATPDDTTRTALSEARGEVRGIVALLESLLDIATSESRRGDRHGLAPVNLSAVATRLGELYAGSAEESCHTFELAIAPDVVVSGEEMQLTRLITNLLDNAFKYVPAGCSVRLSVQPGPIITVADTGPGVREEDRARIFERFQRGGRDRSGGYGSGHGAGLGLALAKAIAERHGLKLTLAPSDRGARFVVSPQENAA